MTVKIINSEETQLLRRKPEVPPSQRRNEDVDSKEECDIYGDGDFFLLSPEVQAAILASSLDAFLSTLAVQALLGSASRFQGDRPNDDFYAENVPTSVNGCVKSTRRSGHRANRPSRVPPSRRVSFAPQLVTDVRTRPRTAPEDLSSLFYTYEETQTFRQEYRVERDMLSREDEAEIETSNHLLLNEDEMNSIFGDDYTSTKSDEHKYDISRVVIMYNDVLETYDGLKHNYRSSKDMKMKRDSDVFFDNDSFWSGSITWY